MDFQTFSIKNNTEMSDINKITHNGNNGSDKDYSKNDFLINLFDIKTANDWINGLDNILYFMIMDCKEDIQVSEIRELYSDVFLIREQFERVMV